MKGVVFMVNLQTARVRRLPESADVQRCTCFRYSNTRARRHDTEEPIESAALVRASLLLHERVKMLNDLDSLVAGNTCQALWQYLPVFWHYLPAASVLPRRSASIFVRRTHVGAHGFGGSLMERRLRMLQSKSCLES
jgi:hypothetical protein